MTPEDASRRLLPPPQLTRVFQRTRLFRKIDDFGRSPATWISGLPGAGKTTLAASYVSARKAPCLWYQIVEDEDDLATFFQRTGTAAAGHGGTPRTPFPLFGPEHVPTVGAFARSFFRAVFETLPAPFVLVFDDYQELRPDSRLHEVVKAGIEEAPEGIRFIVLSRSDPPPGLHRLILNDRLTRISAEDLRLDEDEALGIADLRLDGKAERDTVLKVSENTLGWAAGTVLMLAHLVDGADPGRCRDMTRDTFFKYFAGEIMERMPPDVRDLLLKTAFLPEVNGEFAEKMSGMSGAGRILSELHERNYFTEKYAGSNTLYRYHPLFRAFLLARAEEVFGPEGLKNLKRQCIQLLEKSGRIEGAVKLSIEAGQWPSAVSLITTHAPALLEKGQYGKLETWLDSLPGNVLEESPWLLFYRGVCHLFTDPRAGLPLFEKAFDLFPRANIVGKFASWSGVVDAILYTWDDFRQLDSWIEKMDRMRRGYMLIPVPRIKYRVASSMFGALMYRKPYHPDMDTWIRRAASAARSSPFLTQRMLISFQLATYFVWNGDFAKAGIVVDDLEKETHSRTAPAMTRITSALVSSLYYWLAEGDHESCIREVTRGLQLAEESGVHVWDGQLLGSGAASAMTAGELDAAEEYLARMNACTQVSRCLERSYYHYMAGWLSYLKTDTSQAIEHTTTALGFAEEVGVLAPLALDNQAMALLKLEAGEFDSALEHVTRARELARGRTAGIPRFARHLILSRIHARRGRKEQALDELHVAMVEGRMKGYWTLPWFKPVFLTEVCMDALRAGIETDYVREFVRRRKLVPETPPLDVPAWPWPLKAYTLGKFAMLLDDSPLEFSGKTQRKPLELLKTLIAFGGNDVSRDRLTDTLWPDADGDNALRSLKTTLHRLRKLIGLEDAIRFQDGKLSLDPRFWWIDTWALESAIAESESMGRIKGSDLSGIYERIAELYQGDFLENVNHPPCVLTMRERLRLRVLRVLESAASEFERNDMPETAVDVYLRALEIDDLTEGVYQRLMECYGRLGRRAEALAVYDRCRKALAAGLGVDPSPDTERMYRELRGRGT